MLTIREDKWLEWCATFNAHTSLSEIWRKLRITTGKLPRAPAHPQPLQEAKRLAEHFSECSSSVQLPPEIRLHLQQVQLEREVVRTNGKESQLDGSHDRTQGGFGTVALRTLYIHAIRSLTNYATPALNTLSEGQWEKLEVAQNNAMRTGLTSLQSRTERLTACLATKLFTRARESDIKTGLLRLLNLNRDVFNKKTWLLCGAEAINRPELKDIILSKGPDTMSPDYSTPAPWESPPAVFNILQTGTRK
ncbi:putative RNA-directed DNA polymerase from mobile element jockey-like 50, partial [Homarus americanus]